MEKIQVFKSTDSIEVIIDQGFRSLIPPLAKEEYELLKESILEEGCRDPLVVWDNTLIDGHNRYEICWENKIQFNVVSKDFRSREEAEDWIDKNQLGRRNLTPDQSSLLRGRRYNRVKKAKESNLKKGTTFLCETCGERIAASTPIWHCPRCDHHWSMEWDSECKNCRSYGDIVKRPKPQNEVSGNTAKKLASQHGVSKATIERDGQFAKAVEKVKELDKEIEQKVTRNEAPPKKAIVLAAEILEKHPEKAEAILKGEIKTADVTKELRKEKNIEKEKEALKNYTDDNEWNITDNQEIVNCNTVITDPPYGILDQEWEPLDLGKFTREWVSKWNSCNADIFLIFWSQRHYFLGKQIFDECLTNYFYQQTLIWHYPNNKKPQSRMMFKQTYEPILFYRKINSDVEICNNNSGWGEDLHDFDCHVAATPQNNFNDHNMKQHPSQKPLAVMRWLINATTKIGQLVCDPFAGSGTTGIACKQLKRKFIGIEINEEYRELAKRRILSYGQ